MGCCEKETAANSGKPAHANVHIHLHVPDLAASTEFYRTLFGEEPVKQFADYSKFLPGWAPLNLALSQAKKGAERGTANGHFGIQLPDAGMVESELNRIKAAGLQVRIEKGVDCCHANQDKFWVRDPMGIEWEIYHLNFDLKDDARKETNSACCEPSTATACCAR